VAAAAAPLRVCVDLNVFVAAERALRRPTRGTLPERIVEAIEEREIILVGSINMFQRLRERLEDAAELSVEEAAERAEFYRLLADPPALLTRQQPVLTLGVGPDAEEDARVLEAALSGRADFLVTYNIADFLPACSPHPTTAHPQCLGVQVIRPADLAVHLGWPLRVVPPPTRMPPDPPSSGGRCIK
jgi:predicted nucleic acid-binding protein